MVLASVAGLDMVYVHKIERDGVNRVDNLDPRDGITAGRAITDSQNIEDF